MRNRTTFWLTAAVVVALAGGCAVDVEDEGEAPEIEVENGEAPDVDVTPAEIDVSTDTQTVVTPDVDIEPRNP